MRGVFPPCPKEAVVRIMTSAPSQTLRRLASARIPTKWGSFETVGFELESLNGARHVDTVEANRALGFKDDARDFGLSVAILRELGLDRVRLLTNNPNKVRALTDGGIAAEQLSCEAEPNSHSLAYLRTKKERMGHQLRL